jgi:hypothetical protein
VRRDVIQQEADLLGAESQTAMWLLIIKNRIGKQSKPLSSFGQ